MEMLSGYKLAEVKGKNWFDTFLAERDVPRIAEVFAKAKSGVPTSGNLNAIVTRDGTELTKRLLAFSRKEPLQQERIDLTAFLAHLQRFLRRTLGTDITVQVDVDATVDQLFCDPNQLESALLNLGLNARDAMPKGGRLSLQADAKDAANLDAALNPGLYVALSLTDTGVGMTPEQLARAIEPFYTTKGRGQGSGLGLSMVFSFCEQAGGRFQLKSRPGAGTQATIILPLNGLGAQEARARTRIRPRVFDRRGDSPGSRGRSARR